MRRNAGMAVSDEAINAILVSADCLRCSMVDSSKPSWRVDLDGLNYIVAFYHAPATAGAQSFSELMRIQGNGRVGIGTVSPSHILDVGNIASTASFSNTLRVTGHKYNEVATFATLRLQNGLYSASGQESYKEFYLSSRAAIMIWYTQLFYLIRIENIPAKPQPEKADSSSGNCEQIIEVPHPEDPSEYIPGP